MLKSWATSAILCLAALLGSVTTKVIAQDSRVPLSPNDRERLAHVFSFEIPWTPNLTKVMGRRPLILGAVLFDGTSNDNSDVPLGERQTVVGHINDRLQFSYSMDFVRYYKGVGTQASRAVALADAAIAFTLKTTAERAVDETLKEILKEQSLKPDADIRILVSGFSRGGAAARHFMNLLEQRWQKLENVNSVPRFYALIFDTVATGQRTNLLLQVPVTSDLFLHFVSIDERRVFFDPVIDISQDDVPGRIVTIPLPGAHSDGGTAYVAGIGSEYLAHIDALISAMGLTPQQCIDIQGDARSEGKHDSRWTIERLMGIGGPNTPDAKERNVNQILADAVPSEFLLGWQRRMELLSFDGQVSNSRCIHFHEAIMLEFALTRREGNFEVVSLPPVDLPSARIVSENHRNYLTYTWDGVTLSRIEIASSVLGRLVEGQRARLSLAVVRGIDGGSRYWWFLDNERVQMIDGIFR